MSPLSDSAPNQDSGNTRQFDGIRLAAMSKTQLIELLIEVSQELKSRMGEDTASVSDQSRMPVSFPDFNPAQVTDFIRLPLQSDKNLGEAQATTWKLVFVSADPLQAPFGVEIYDDIIIGRLTEDVSVDLDLTAYEADQLGVSREHALLRPTRDRLMIYDLGSANGTYRNGERAKLGGHLEVDDGDALTLGGMHLLLRVVKRPE